MRKYAVLLLLMLCCACSSNANGAEILNSVSPKLRQFLMQTPTALTALTNSLAEAFTNRTIQLYYFYSDDETKARALHYYPDEAVVGILMRENQEPLDEYLCFVFEVVNSRGEKRFRELAEQAAAGTISKTNFVREVQRQEFQAIKKVRALLDTLKLSEKDKRESYYFKKHVECPGDFEGFLAYKPKGAVRDVAKEYEQQYDDLRRAAQQTEPRRESGSRAD